MSLEEHPRLINQIPRGSKLYGTIKKLRSASERSNSSLKPDLKILDHPRVMSGPRAAILAQMADIFLLLKRAFSFIVRITLLFRKALHSKDPTLKEKLNPPSIPKSIAKIIQRE